MTAEFYKVKIGEVLIDVNVTTVTFDYNSYLVKIF